MYSYFVSYCYSIRDITGTSETYFNNANIERESPVICLEDVGDLENKIKDSMLLRNTHAFVSVLNWRRYESPE